MSSRTHQRKASKPAAPTCPIDILHDRLHWLREQPRVNPGDLTEYIAFCPAHDAGIRFEPGAAPTPPTRPLRIYADRTGTIDRFECDDGCTQCAVLRALGVEMADLIANPWADELGAAERMRARQSPGANKSADAKATDASSFAYEPVAVRLSDVKPEALAWLWPGRIPLGKLTVVAGDPGLGKTFLTHDIAARVSNGSGWPDHAPDSECAASESAASETAGEVILLSAEDGLADTIRPRLDAAGADISRIIALTAVRSFDGHETAFSLSRDLNSLELVLKQCERPRLVVIDPISAYLSRTDSHNNAEVRALLAPLARLAEQHRVAVIAVNHLNKGGGGGKAIYRSMGSLAFIAAARAGWLIARSSEDSERRLMLVAKLNVAKEPTGLSYRIVDGRIAWDDEPVNVTADEALNGDGGGGGGGGDGDGCGAGRGRRESSTRIREVIDWVHAKLGDAEMSTSDLRMAAVDAGISDITLRRAKVLAKLRVRRVGFGPGGEVYLSRRGRPSSKPGSSPTTMFNLTPNVPAHAPQ